jgi:biopolymer transport protein ExbD
MRSRAAFNVFAVADDRPISEMNTTPLIDVMLVLLIMFILTVPLATHSVKMNLPTDGTPLGDPQVHRLALDSTGRLFWDGAALSESNLPARLESFRRTGPEDVLEIQSEAETRYETFDRVLATVKRSGIGRLGFVGNERYAGDID